MKKTLISSLLALALTLSLAACAADVPEAKATEPAGAPESAAPEGVSLASFAALDLEGNDVDASIFADCDLTMLNVWGTFCGPCISEMPELAQLSEDYAAKGVRIVGLVVDVSSPDASADAWDIIAQTGADYLHILPSEDLNAAFLSGVNAVPTTLFFNSEGAQVGGEYVGSRSYDDWAAIIDGLLAPDTTGGESAIETGG